MENNSAQDLQKIMTGLSETTNGLTMFLSKLQANLPQEEKELLDKEMKKAQDGLNKLSSDLSNFKI